MYTTTQSPATQQRTTRIDMYTPSQASAELGVGDDVLLSMINDGQLAAYNLGGAIRLKAIDVQAAAALLAAA